MWFKLLATVVLKIQGIVIYVNLLNMWTRLLNVLL